MKPLLEFVCVGLSIFQLVTERVYVKYSRRFNYCEQGGSFDVSSFSPKNLEEPLEEKLKIDRLCTSPIKVQIE